MKGGIAVVVSPDKFGEICVDKVYVGGNLLTDAEAARTIGSMACLGMLMSQEETRQRFEGLGLPEDTRVAVIAKPEIDGVDSEAQVKRAIRHEEDEVIGLAIDQAMGQSRVARLLDRVSPPSARMQVAMQNPFYKGKFIPALHHIAALVEDGEGALARSSLNITPAEAEANPYLVEILDTIVAQVERDNRRGVGRGRSENPRVTAELIRGGLLRPENILRYLDVGGNLHKFLDRRGRTERPEGISQGPVLASRGEGGRFLSGVASLASRDILIVEGLGYTIIRILATGGMGVVYLAKDSDGRSVAIKEAIGYLPLRLIDRSAVEAFIEVAKQEQWEPDEFLVELQRGLYYSSHTGEAFRASEADAYMNYLNNFIQLKTGVNDVLVFDSASNRWKFSYMNVQNYLIEALKQAMIRYTTLENAKRHRAWDETVMDRTLAEYHRALLPKHPRIGYSIGVGVSRNGPGLEMLYVVQNYVDGTTLESAIEEASGGWRKGKVLKYLQDLFGLVKICHDKGIVHLDIKPLNCLTTPDGTSGLVDFGLAREQSRARTGMTVVLGTPPYTPREVIIADFGDIGPWSDIYSLGMVAFQLAVGEVDLNGMVSEAEAKGMDWHQYIRYKIVEYNAGKLHGEQYSEQFIQAIIKATMSDPDDRFGSVEDFTRSLEQETGWPKPRAKPAPAAPPEGSQGRNLHLDTWGMSGQAGIEGLKEFYEGLLRDYYSFPERVKRNDRWYISEKEYHQELTAVLERILSTLEQNFCDRRPLANAVAIEAGRASVRAIKHAVSIYQTPGKKQLELVVNILKKCRYGQSPEGISAITQICSDFLICLEQMVNEKPERLVEIHGHIYRLQAPGAVDITRPFHDALKRFYRQGGDWQKLHGGRGVDRLVKAGKKLVSAVISQESSATITTSIWRLVYLLNGYSQRDGLEMVLIPIIDVLLDTNMRWLNEFRIISGLRLPTARKVLERRRRDMAKRYQRRWLEEADWDDETSLRFLRRLGVVDPY